MPKRLSRRLDILQYVDIMKYLGRDKYHTRVYDQDMKIQNTPGPKPTSIRLSEYQRQHLNAIVNRRNSTQRIVERAKIILIASEGLSNVHIAQEIEVHEHLDELRIRRIWSV